MSFAIIGAPAPPHFVILQKYLLSIGLKQTTRLDNKLDAAIISSAPGDVKVGAVAANVINIIDEYVIAELRAPEKIKELVGKYAKLDMQSIGMERFLERAFNDAEVCIFAAIVYKDDVSWVLSSIGRIYDNTHADKFFPGDLPRHVAEYALVQTAQFISIIEDAVRFRFGVDIAHQNSTYSYQVIAINISISSIGSIRFNSFDTKPDKPFVGGGRRADDFIAARGEWEVNMLKSFRIVK